MAKKWRSPYDFNAPLGAFGEAESARFNAPKPGLSQQEEIILSNRNAMAQREKQANRAIVDQNRNGIAMPAGEATWNPGVEPTGQTMEVINGDNRVYTGYFKNKNGVLQGVDYATPWGAQNLKSSDQMMEEGKAAAGLQNYKDLYDYRSGGGGGDINTRAKNTLYPNQNPTPTPAGARPHMTASGVRQVAGHFKRNLGLEAPEYSPYNPLGYVDKFLKEANKWKLGNSTTLSPEPSAAVASPGYTTVPEGTLEEVRAEIERRKKRRAAGLRSIE